jgi:hypothetical protein
VRSEHGLLKARACQSGQRLICFSSSFVASSSDVDSLKMHVFNDAVFSLISRNDNIIMAS